MNAAYEAGNPLVGYGCYLCLFIGIVWYFSFLQYLFTIMDICFCILCAVSLCGVKFFISCDM